MRVHGPQDPDTQETVIVRMLFCICVLAISLSCEADSSSPRSIPLEEAFWRLHSIELPLGTAPAAEGQELTLCLHAESCGQRPATITADCKVCGGPCVLGPAMRSPSLWYGRKPHAPRAPRALARAPSGIDEPNSSDDASAHR